jgi:hypothetical protein
MLLRVYTLLTTLLALRLPRRSLSCVGKFARGQFFPLHVRLLHYAVHLEHLHIGNSIVAARSCERMSLHLPGLRHPLQALHLRSRWHLPRRKLGRRQDLGYLEELRGVLALASRCLVSFIYKVAISHPKTLCYVISGTLFPV